jgi:hypothetical protein
VMAFPMCWAASDPLDAWMAYSSSVAALSISTVEAKVSVHTELRIVP